LRERGTAWEESKRSERLYSAVATSRVKVAPVWSWNEMSFPSGDQAGMIWAVFCWALGVCPWLYPARHVVKIDVLYTIAVGDIGESFLVRRPRGTLLVKSVVGKGHGSAPDRHEVELVEGNECNLFFRRRKCGGVEAFGLDGGGGVEVVTLARILGRMDLMTATMGRRFRSGGEVRARICPSPV